MSTRNWLVLVTVVPRDCEEILGQFSLVPLSCSFLPSLFICMYLYTHQYIQVQHTHILQINITVRHVVHLPLATGTTIIVTRPNCYFFLCSIAFHHHHRSLAPSHSPFAQSTSSSKLKELNFRRATLRAVLSNMCDSFKCIRNCFLLMPDSRRTQQTRLGLTIDE